MKSDESNFPAHLFAYDTVTGAITKDGRRRDYADNPYRRVCENQNRVCAHRLAWRIHTGAWPAFEVDHVNLNKQDNSWSNLRVATASQNQCNKPGVGKSGERGVHFCKTHSRWKISLGIKGQRRFQHYCSSKTSAILAARIIRRVLHGEFAFASNLHARLVQG